MRPPHLKNHNQTEWRGEGSWGSRSVEELLPRTQGPSRISMNTQTNAAPRLRDHLWKPLRETTIFSQASKTDSRKIKRAKRPCNITTDSRWYAIYRPRVKSQEDASAAGHRGRVGEAEQERNTGPTLSSSEIWLHPCRQTTLMLNQVGGRAGKLYQCLGNANRQANSRSISPTSENS